VTASPVGRTVRRAGQWVASTARPLIAVSAVTIRIALSDDANGHLARDGREDAIRLLETYRDAEVIDVHAVDARWTLNEDSDASADNAKGDLSGDKAEAL
jgi:hypothetical protein